MIFGMNWFDFINIFVIWPIPAVAAIVIAVLGRNDADEEETA